MYFLPGWNNGRIVPPFVFYSALCFIIPLTPTGMDLSVAIAETLKTKSYETDNDGTGNSSLQPLLRRSPNESKYH
jgi:hypothetical protein